MKLDPSRCTVVVVGSWNMAIFAQRASETLGSEGGERVDIEFGIGPGAQTTLRIPGESFTFLARADRLLWQCNKSIRSDLGSIRARATDLLGRLNMTPVTAMGMNFGGRVENSKLEGPFAEVPALAHRGLEQEAVLIRRKLTRADGVVNLSVEQMKDGSHSIGVNFHYDVSSAPRAAELIERALLVNRDEAVGIIESALKIEVEDDE